MEAKKTRGRKPLKDKKRSIRIYVLDSEIKKMGGDQKLINKLYGFIEREVNNYKI